MASRISGINVKHVKKKKVEVHFLKVRIGLNRRRLPEILSRGDGELL